MLGRAAGPDHPLRPLQGLRGPLRCQDPPLYGGWVVPGIAPYYPPVIPTLVHPPWYPPVYSPPSTAWCGATGAVPYDRF